MYTNGFPLYTNKHADSVLAALINFFLYERISGPKSMKNVLTVSPRVTPN